VVFDEEFKKILDIYPKIEYDHDVRFSYRGGFMSTVEVTSLSSKGQIVIPSTIRNEMSIETGAKFVVISDGDTILLKPIHAPSAEEFKRLKLETDRFVKENNLKQEDLPMIIKKVRRRTQKSS